MNDWLVAWADCGRQHLYVLALLPTPSMSRGNGIGISDAMETWWNSGGGAAKGRRGQTRVEYLSVSLCVLMVT